MGYRICPNQHCLGWGGGYLSLHSGSYPVSHAKSFDKWLLKYITLLHNRIYSFQIAESISITSVSLFKPRSLMSFICPSFINFIFIVCSWSFRILFSWYSFSLNDFSSLYFQWGTSSSIPCSPSGHSSLIFVPLPSEYQYLVILLLT